MDVNVEYNGVRNATFIMIQALIAELAIEKGQAGEEWLKELRDRVLRDLDAAKMRNPADETKPEVAQIAETARSVVGATFEMAEHRFRNSR